VTYYLLIPERLVEANTNLHTDRYELGEESFGTFYPEQGYYLFEDLTERAPSLLEEIEIRTDQDEGLTPEEFLERLEDLTVLV
jgi:hypothetical protein